MSKLNSIAFRRSGQLPEEHTASKADTLAKRCIGKSAESVQVNFVINKDNINEFRKLIDYAEATFSSESDNSKELN